MCIMCGCAECTGEGVLGNGGTGGTGSGAGYVLIDSGPDSSIPNSNLKWGDDTLGTASDEVTWSLSLAGLNLSNFAEELFVQAAQAAFDAWAAVANLTFRFIEGDADIDVTTATAGEQPGLSGTTVGLASYAFGNGSTSNDGVAEITAATIYMDEANAWSPTGEDGILSYYAVLLHELGHAIGLGHVTGSVQIMNTPISTNDLQAGDIAGARALYGLREAGTNDADTIDLAGVQTAATIYGRDGNDVITGSDVGDSLFGGAGDDTLNGGEGDDFLVDVRGTNTLSGGDDNDTILGGLGNLSGNGDDGNDVIIGGIFDDTLDGGDGNDALRGDPSGGYFGGNDRLIAGEGDDLLEGGSGADVFVFANVAGNNTIAKIDNIGTNPTAGAADYEVGIDQIEMTDFGFTVADDARDAFVDTVGGASFDNGTFSIVVVGTLVDDLDFIV